MITAGDLFKLSDNFSFADVFTADLAPWEWVPRIRQALAAFDFEAVETRSDLPRGLHVEGAVFLHPSVQLPPYGFIKGPCFIGAETELRPGVFIRGNVIAGVRCVMGNASEFKNCLLLDDVDAPHYNYVGDSIIGNGAHLAAGVICSNLRLDQAHVPVTLADGSRVDSGLRKLGVMAGDGAEVGCNTVLNPGTVLGRKSLVMPAMAYGGFLPDGAIATSTARPKIVSP